MKKLNAIMANLYFSNMKLLVKNYTLQMFRLSDIKRNIFLLISFRLASNHGIQLLGGRRIFDRYCVFWNIVEFYCHLHSFNAEPNEKVDV